MLTATAFRRACRCAPLLFCLTAVVHAQSPPSAPDGRALNWAQKMFAEQSIDFGTIARGADARYRLKLTNLYKQSVHIANVRTSCGCAAANPSKSTLDSREVAYVEVTMDTERFSHRKDSNLIVTFDAPLFQEVTIPITAYIRTDVVLTPGAANFGSVDLGSATRRKIEVAYAGRDDWTIRDVQPHNEYVAAEAKEISRGNGRVNYEVYVTLKPNAPVGVIRDQVTLLTDDALSPEVPLLVEARVEADITVTPAVVALGTLGPGDSRPTNVVLRGRKPFAIEKIECASDQDAFKVRLPKDERAVHVLPLTFTAPDRPGDFTEEFTVTIAGRPEPVTFKAYGTIRAK
ncbi:MAG: DUF1573 domain-containing protein [Planctomycetales bacterium]